MDMMRITDNLDAAVTVCDTEGIILYMNERACKTFEKDGGIALVGKSLMDCHPEPARSKLREMMTTQKPNCYTIEKGGIKKLIYQAPWFDSGTFGGFVEFSFQIPMEMPHFIRT